MIKNAFTVLMLTSGRLLRAGAAVLMFTANNLSAQQPPDPSSLPSTPISLPPTVAIGGSHLPRDLSPWSMFRNADMIVQAVMLGLGFASLVTWTVWLAKTIQLTQARRQLSRLLATVSQQNSLTEACAHVGSRRGILPALLDAARLELRLSADTSDKAAIKERIATRLARLEAAGGREMNKGTGLLATIGATAPFVGLFGTVWGIMNSFIGIFEGTIDQPCHRCPRHCRSTARHRDRVVRSHSC